VERNVIYYGVPDAQPEPIALRAGPLELAYQAGDLRYIRLGTREIVSRIYFALRDADWGTAPNTIERHTIELGSRGFRIAHSAHSRLGDADVAWHAEISGAPDGTITYRVTGRAKRTFLSNRLGLCLLHPASLAGARCRVVHGDGSEEEGRFPERIAPHQPFLDIAAISCELTDGIWASSEFKGDTFEMEDQRNWTDASFKTYPRPLALPYPFEMHSGERFEQTVTLRLQGVSAVAATCAAPDATLHVGVAAHGEGVLPPIGLHMGAEPPCQGVVIERLRALEAGHLRVALAPETDEGTLTCWAQMARAVDAPLELALLDGGAATADRAAEWLAREQLSVTRVLLCASPGCDATSLLACSRRTLETVAPNATFWVGTDGDFVDLNRERPQATGATGVFYSLNPQVHAFDNASLVESLPVQAETVLSARALYPDLSVAVTPITLRPRGAIAADPRQPSLFAAGWMLGSIAALARSGVSALTYGEIAGPRGTMSRDGAPYALYHLLLWLAGWRGARVCSIEVSDLLRLQGLALQRNGERCIVLANMGGKPMVIKTQGIGAAARVQWLDERCVVDTRWQGPTAPAPLKVGAGQAEIELLPYGLARIESSAP